MEIKFNYPEQGNITIPSIVYKDEINASVEFSISNRTGVLIKAVSYNIVSVKDGVETIITSGEATDLPDGATSKKISVELKEKGLGKIIITKVTYASEATQDMNVSCSFGDMESVREYVKANSSARVPAKRQTSSAPKATPVAVDNTHNELTEDQVEAKKSVKNIALMALGIAGVFIIVVTVLGVTVGARFGLDNATFVLLLPILGSLVLYITGLVLTHKRLGSIQSIKEKGLYGQYVASAILFPVLFATAILMNLIFIGLGF